MRKKLVNSRLRLTLLAASIGALSLGASAAGLGRITVMSGLGQPLRAEVEIAAAPDELQNVSARLASAEAFRQAGIDYSPAITGLRMSVERRGNGAVVKVQSDRPINEPFVDMLVELNWASGRLIREYTFLLDPPEAGNARANVAVAPPEVRPATPARVADAPPPARRPVVPRAPRPMDASVAATGRTYLVRPGDTLNRIAAENRPADVSMEQMLQALYQGNRGAFGGDDINRLQAGRIIQIPDSDSVRQLAGGQKLVGQAADFGRYRQKLGDQAAVMPPKDAPVRQGSTGQIGAKVEDRAPQGAASSDQLKVSKNEEALRGGTAAGEKSSARLQALEEDLVSRDKALKEANARLAELERSIKELQRLVELKSQALAQPEAVARPAAPAPVEPAPAVIAKPAETEKPAEMVTAKPPEPVVEAPKPPPAPPVEPPKPVEAPKPPPPPPHVAESSGVDSSLLLGGGGILALLLGWGAYKMYQRRSNPGAPTTTPALSEFGDGNSSVFGSAGGQSVDTGSSSQIQTDFSQSGLSSIDTDEGVDPVAEADVYMAYGRDAQAEEILLDALKTDPGRAGVHLKLLEIYAQRKNLKQFETTATELYSLTGGNGSDWEKAAALGRKVDPESPLYRIPAPGVVSGPVVMPAVPSHEAHTIAGGLGVGASSGFGGSSERRSDSGGANPDDPLESPSQLKDTWALPGELNQYADLEDIGRAPTPQAAPQTAMPDGGVLDFDLDLEPDPGTSDVRATMLVSNGGSSSGGVSVDLDLGFDEPPRSASKDAPRRELERTSTRTPRVADDFALPDPSDLDFEISSEFGENQAAKPLSNSMLDVDLTATLADEGFRDPGGTATIDLERTSFDSSLLDFDFELEDKASLDMTATRPFGQVSDLAALDGSMQPTVEVGASLDDLGPPTEPPLDFDLQQEVATKLELARAYEEMGDKDGARELVEEVLREGSGQQKDEARVILARLS